MGFYDELGAGAVVGVQAGMTKDAVTKLQRALLAKGYDPQGIDGVFGTNTALALKAYLAKYGNLSGLGAEVAALEAVYVAQANQLAKTAVAIAPVPAAQAQQAAAKKPLLSNPLFLGGLALVGVGLFYFLVIRKSKKA